MIMKMFSVTLSARTKIPFEGMSVSSSSVFSGLDFAFQPMLAIDGKVENNNYFFWHSEVLPYQWIQVNQ